MENTEAIIETIETEEMKYFFVVYGDVPGILMPNVAYRRERWHERAVRELRVIKCPHCLSPLTDVGKDTKVELFRYPARKKIRCQAYPLCLVCKNEVGMILA